MMSFATRCTLTTGAVALVTLAGCQNERTFVIRSAPPEPVQGTPLNKTAPSPEAFAYALPGMSEPVIGDTRDAMPDSDAWVSFRTTGAPQGTPVLDGMESLSQLTFAGEGAAFDPSANKDGTIVFASTQHRPTADIYVMPAGGNTLTQLTADPAQDVMPVFSPDGTRVAFASDRAGSWDVYVMSARGGQPVQITSGPDHELHPTWSPDGSRLVFCRLGAVSGAWEMWVAEVDRPRSAEFIGYGMFPSWCPVEQTGVGGRDRILFQRARERGDRRFSLWTVDYSPGDASTPTEIVGTRDAAFINPSWSPDGQTICFASVHMDDRSFSERTTRPHASDLWMASADGGGRVELTTGGFLNLMPTWGADGRIYFVSDRDGVDNIWSIGSERALTALRGGNPDADNTDVATVQTAP